MKVEGIIFSFFGLFAGAAALVYWFWSKDPTGTAALTLTTGLGFLVGGYLMFTGRRIGMRPQDLPDAEIADGAGELGHFTPGSYYPFFIGASAVTAAMGFVFGVWLIVLGAVLVVSFVTCLVFENFWHPPVPED
ncbi:cytochrome c oxidase subunit 4 [Frankia sp. AgPm24]|uniref:Cytochrome c oxidase polypeptide 4 n=1 Tax=Frankia umida TaxID=573489 RepID=A0ABT0K3E8_9ACTN|nr:MULTISPECIES: cytochrome c oxidase subunit 4 [Frankia]MCK9877803.1 cytochrome c oxidase subunit 4 [Frankia umida]MCK9925200.1 cytochrome c oxidase subunit 4 [Frankia sp. AgPm24]